MANPEHIIFLHIPKTGGSSLDWVMSKKYKNHTVIKLKPEEILDFNYYKLANQNLYLSGHMGYGIHSKSIKDNQVKYITMLRNPVERVISFYYWASIKSKVEIGLSNFVSQDTPFRNNTQTKLLSIDDGVIKLPKMSESQMLNKAKYTIKHKITCLGLTEYFDESMLLFKKVFNWSSNYYLRIRENSSRPLTSSIDDSTIQLIRDKNYLDIELYNYATQIFKENIRSNNINLSVGLKIFQLNNLVFKHLWMAGRKIKGILK
jgi:hypothetical protein